MYRFAFVFFLCRCAEAIGFPKDIFINARWRYDPDAFFDHVKQLWFEGNISNLWAQGGSGTDTAGRGAFVKPAALTDGQPPSPRAAHAKSPQPNEPEVSMKVGASANP